jgi:predicted 3-demethylubiquinone-9 3-methyltransferase (glyoxalase superfamily)
VSDVYHDVSDEQQGKGPDMTSVTTCLWFNGNAEEAVDFYVSLVPDSKITAVSRYGPGMPYPEGMVMTVAFELAGSPFTALNAGPEYSFTEAISLQLSATDQDEVDHYWERLSDGGQPGPCGWIKDRFGLSWQVVPDAVPELLSDPDPARAHAAGQALMTMSKIDVAALYRAAESASGQPGTIES